MKKLDFIGSGFWLLLGFLICEESWQINLGEFRNPGPGFLPFGAGLILGGLAFALLVKTLRGKSGGDRAFWAERRRWPKVSLTLTSIFVYGFLLEPVGFLLMTFLIMGFLFRVIEPQRWRTVIAGALFSAVGAYLIFEVWLKVELPKGFLGI
jgi:putative tricarboxylic transport membrane protein